MKKIVIILYFIFLILFNIFSQGEIDDEEKIFYRNERTFALSLNTNGIGGNFRYAKRDDAFRKIIYEIDLSYIKHEKEVKVTSIFYPFSRSFIYGKKNVFVSLKGGMGLQNELFRKIDKGGISIRSFYSGGPSIGFLKPIYYEINYQTGVNTYETRIEKFNIDHISTGTIEGKASFFKGMDELMIAPGFFGKVGFSFEFGKYDEVFNAIEGGLQLETYLKFHEKFPFIDIYEVPIMASEYNPRLFITLFLSYRFGKIIDALFKTDKSKLDELLLE